MNNGEDLPSVKTLIQAYKKALLGGDQEAIDEMEAAICYLESVKNDLSVKFEEMTGEIASGMDKFLRVKADFENFRKQSEKDRATFASDIRGDVIECLLPLVDTFERTKQDAKPETEKERMIETSYQGIYKQFVEVMRSMDVAVVETVGTPFDPAKNGVWAPISGAKAIWLVLSIIAMVLLALSGTRIFLSCSGAFIIFASMNVIASNSNMLHHMDSVDFFQFTLHEAISREECQQFKAGIVSQEIRHGFVLGDRLLRSATVKVSTGPVLVVNADSAVDGSEQPQDADEPVTDSTQDTGDT